MQNLSERNGPDQFPVVNIVKIFYLPTHSAAIDWWLAPMLLLCFSMHTLV